MQCVFLRFGSALCLRLAAGFVIFPPALAAQSLAGEYGYGPELELADIPAVTAPALPTCPTFVDLPLTKPLSNGDRVASFGNGLVARVSALATDADGASAAYRPDGRGLDFLCNAVKAYVNGACLDVTTAQGKPACNKAVAAAQKSHWDRASSLPMCIFGFEAPTKDKSPSGSHLPLWGGKYGNGPLPIQSESDPSPGAFVSVTSFPVSIAAEASRTTAYANADVVPFVVAPSEYANKGVLVAKRGAAAIVRTKDLHTVYAVVGDTRNDDALGEVSIAAVQLISDASLSKPVLPRTDAKPGDPLPVPYRWKDGALKAGAGPNQGPYLIFTFGKEEGVVNSYDVDAVRANAKSAADALGGAESLARCASAYFEQK